MERDGFAVGAVTQCKQQGLLRRRRIQGEKRFGIGPALASHGVERSVPSERHGGKLSGERPNVRAHAGHRVDRDEPAAVGCHCLQNGKQGSVAWTSSQRLDSVDREPRKRHLHDVGQIAVGEVDLVDQVIGRINPTRIGDAVNCFLSRYRGGRRCWLRSFNRQNNVISRSVNVTDRRIHAGTEEIGDNRSFGQASKHPANSIRPIVVDDRKSLTRYRRVRPAHYQSCITQGNDAIDDEVIILGRRVSAVDLDRERVVVIQRKVAVDCDLAGTRAGSQRHRLGGGRDVLGVCPRRDMNDSAWSHSVHAVLDRGKGIKAKDCGRAVVVWIHAGFGAYPTGVYVDG
jgi:hypothetical protein